MSENKQIQSMIYLLDDEDQEVVDQIMEQLKAKGEVIIPLLEEVENTDSGMLRRDRAKQLLTEIKGELLVEKLEEWQKDGAHDLLEGSLILARLNKYDLDTQEIENKIDRIKLDAWLELKYDTSSFDKVKILNYVFFDLHEFKGDTESYHSPLNSFLPEVLSRKKGNPISMAILYSIVAQKLNIPIYGVNLPQHFILGYRNDTTEWETIARINDPGSLRDRAGSDVLFYINPFNKGMVFSKESVTAFLNQIKVEPKDQFYYTCSNRAIVKRMIRNLMYAYELRQEEDKIPLLQRMIKVLDNTQ